MVSRLLRLIICAVIIIRLRGSILSHFRDLKSPTIPDSSLFLAWRVLKYSCSRAFYKDLFVTSRQLILLDNANKGFLHYACETSRSVFFKLFTVSSQWRCSFPMASSRLCCSEAQWFRAHVVTLVSQFSFMWPLSSFLFSTKSPPMNAKMQRSVKSLFSLFFLTYQQCSLLHRFPICLLVHTSSCVPVMYRCCSDSQYSPNLSSLHQAELLTSSRMP